MARKEVITCDLCNKETESCKTHVVDNIRYEVCPTCDHAFDRFRGRGQKLPSQPVFRTFSPNNGRNWDAPLAEAIAKTSVIGVPNLPGPYQVFGTILSGELTEGKSAVIQVTNPTNGETSSLNCRISD